jgi:hypothetical protein
MIKRSHIEVEFERLVLAKESELELDGRLLKIHFQLAYESLKPLNIIKSTFKQIISAPGLKTGVVDTLMGLASGFVAKKILVGRSHNPFAKLLGSLIEIFVSNKLTNNADEIRSVGSVLIKKLIHQNGTPKL